MYSLNQEVVKLLEDSKIWVLASCDKNPNVIPVLFKTIDEDKLVIFDVFMNKTLDNIKVNENVAITVYNDNTLQGYQIKGTAIYTTDEDLVKAGNSVTNKFNLTTKGALIVEPTEAYIQSPGPDIGKKI